MAKIFQIQIPTDSIIQGIRAAKRTAHALNTIDAERRQKFPIDNEYQIRERFGEDGLAAYREYVSGCVERKAEIISRAADELDSIQAAAVEQIDEQVTPDGDDVVANAGDFELLRHGLIINAEQLERLRQKHADSAAFAIAADKYATERGWENFEFLTVENSIREYVDTVFSGLRRAATAPDGLSYQQFCATPDEYQRSATAHGLADVFAESGGDRIAKAVRNDDRASVCACAKLV